MPTGYHSSRRGPLPWWNCYPSRKKWYGSGKNNYAGRKSRKPVHSKEKHPSVIMYEYLKKNGYPEP